MSQSQAIQGRGGLELPEESKLNDMLSGRITARKTRGIGNQDRTGEQEKEGERDITGPRGRKGENIKQSVGRFIQCQKSCIEHITLTGDLEGKTGYITSTYVPACSKPACHSHH